MDMWVFELFQRVGSAEQWVKACGALSLVLAVIFFSKLPAPKDKKEAPVPAPISTSGPASPVFAGSNNTYNFHNSPAPGPSPGVQLGDVFGEASKRMAAPGELILGYDVELLHNEGFRVKTGPNSYIEFGKSSERRGTKYQDIYLFGEDFGVWTPASGKPWTGEGPEPAFSMDALVTKRGVEHDLLLPRGIIAVHFPLKKDAVFALTGKRWTIELILKEFSERAILLRLEIRKPKVEELRMIESLKEAMERDRKPL